MLFIKSIFKSAQIPRNHEVFLFPLPVKRKKNISITVPMWLLWRKVTSTLCCGDDHTRILRSLEHFKLTRELSFWGRGWILTPLSFATLGFWVWEVIDKSDFYTRFPLIFASFLTVPSLRTIETSITLYSEVRFKKEGTTPLNFYCLPSKN